MTIIVGDTVLTFAEVLRVARDGERVELAPEAVARMAETRARIQPAVMGDAPVYGITTGFGALANTRIPLETRVELQHALLRSHAAGMGPPVPREIVRAMLLLRARTLAMGYSGVRPVVAQTLLDLINAGITPVVPRYGSLGASGDLAPLAHAALCMTGGGWVLGDGGTRIEAATALARAGLTPLRLEAKEGLALLNGTDGMLGMLVLACVDADGLFRAADLTGAMSVEALLGTDVAFSAALQAARPHPGQVRVAEELRWLLRDSGLQRIHHGSAHKVQDPYSLRCVPQVHGAIRDALDHLRRVLAVEMNAATDNPLVFADGGVADASARATGGGRVISGGNFHGEPIALALDFAKLALAELGSISERRVALLVDPHLNGGLPAFLAAASGLESGLMLLQYTAAALVSEHKVLAHPASVDSIPTSANQEDHVSMGPIAGRHARAVLDGVERIVAIELLCAGRALDLRLAEPALAGVAPGAGVAEAHARLRSVSRPWDADREPGPDLEAATRLVHDGGLADLASGLATAVTGPATAATDPATATPGEAPKRTPA